MPEMEAMAAADRWCRTLLKGHYENFWVSSPLVPRRLRPHMARVYAYCRSVDDLGDESRDQADALGRLDVWRRDVERLLAGGTPAHPVLMALSRSVRELHLEARPFLDLIDANVQDQQVESYRDWTDVIAYCRLSASPVGRIVLAVFGVGDESLVRFSDDVCNGLQLANFAQDVRVDAGKGRCYLPQAEIAAHGTRGAIRAMCEQARTLLSSGHQLEAAVPGRLGLQLAMYRLGGEAIVAAVERGGYRTDEVRPSVPMSAKVRLLLGALWRTRGGGMPPAQEVRS
jgi:squalene synthase HpnC